LAFPEALSALPKASSVLSSAPLILLAVASSATASVCVRFPSIVAGVVEVAIVVPFAVVPFDVVPLIATVVPFAAVTPDAVVFPVTAGVVVVQPCGSSRHLST